MLNLNSNTNNNINILNNKTVQLQQENEELRDINDKIQIKLNQLIEENEQKNNSINQLNEELLIRQQKINNLHNVFNKSISSYSNGIKNSKTFNKLNKKLSLAKQVPVEINYTYRKKRYSKLPDQYDFEVLKKIE